MAGLLPRDLPAYCLKTLANCRDIAIIRMQVQYYQVPKRQYLY